MYAEHLDLTLPLLWTVDGALDAETCAVYVERMRRGVTEVAPIVGGLDLAVRNNTRMMWDEPTEADALLARVASSVPRRFRDEQLRGANPRLRLYRYGVGERHGAHFDTVVELPEGVRSRLTLVFYLNDDFEGGATEFGELSRTIVPRRGQALIFQHRVLHQAMPVSAGEKFVLRTDVLYGPPH